MSIYFMYRKRYQNEKCLKDAYQGRKLNTYQIAKECNVGQTTIWKWLHKLHIPVRSCSEAFHLYKANHCNLSQKAIEWINGELLGDGCIHQGSPYSASFKYSSKYFEYAQYVSDMLESFGIKQSGKIGIQVHKKVNYYFYQSRYYVELLLSRKKWYPNGKKIIPKNIELTSIICRQWFIGDGSLVHQNNQKPYIRFATFGFSISDINLLVKQLIELGFKSNKEPNYNRIHISSYSTKDFLSYIGNSPVRCYDYKFAY